MSFARIWALRVPIASAAILTGLPWLAFSDALRPALSGLFDPVDEKALSLMTAVALFNAWTIAHIARLILAYGRVRMDLPIESPPSFPAPLSTWIVSSLLIGPVIWSVVKYSHQASQHGIAAMLGYAALGAVAAVLLLALTLAASRWFERWTRRRRGQEAFPALVAAYRHLLDTLDRHPFLSAGFITDAEDPSQGRQLARGHGVALFLAIASVALYAATGWLTSDIQRPVLASTLSYVLLLVLVLNWILALATFVLDRIRFPLTLFLLIWIVLVDVFIDRVFPTDNVYRTLTVETPLPAPAPADVLHHAQPIVVAASGGGIQAAAWTARALTGLAAVDGFQSHLRFISAVSGGSVGTMNVLASFANCGLPPPGPMQTLDAANKASQESSLHAIGWGLVFKDLVRAIFPFLVNPAVDRASVLEDAWKREPRLQAPYPDPSPWLTSWRRNVAEGGCPGVVFNAMAVETGEPMLFATVGLPPLLQPYGFYERYPHRDVPITTAVRLSAGFPFVSTAARADIDDVRGKYIHVVDGGYFDIYGVNTLSAWMRAALVPHKPGSDTPNHVLVVELCDTAVCSGHEGALQPSLGGPRQAWPFQIYAPLSGLLATWSTGQLVNNRTLLKLLKDYWKNEGVCVESLEIPFDPPGLHAVPGDPSRRAPLSWHLTPAEKDAIEHEWDRIGQSNRDAVAAFLAGRAATREGEACLAEIHAAK